MIGDIVVLKTTYDILLIKNINHSVLLLNNVKYNKIVIDPNINLNKIKRIFSYFLLGKKPLKVAVLRFLPPNILTSPNPLIKSTTSGLNTESWGGIIVDDNGLTSVEGVYAGGDAVTGAATVILAMGAGRKAAAAIHDYIQNR